MSINCGHCKNRHETVAEVRTCAGNGTPTTPRYADRVNAVAADFNRNLVANPVTLSGADDAHECPICERFCCRPSDHRADCPGYTEHAANGASQPGYRDRAVGGNKVSAGSYPAKATVLIPAGYYATKSRTGQNDYDFWQVKDGRKAGIRFVNRILGGQPPVWISRGEQAGALVAIGTEGTEICAKRFGEELGRCYRCGRSLTDETSRQLGIGPECRKHAA